MAVKFKGRANMFSRICVVDKCVGMTTLLWIPVHHGIADNDEANACVKEAAENYQRCPRPVSLATASELI